MIYNGKKAIFEAIKKDSQKKALLENFKKQITESNSLALEYVITEEVAKYAGKLNLKEAKAFVKSLNTKFGEQLKQTEYDFKSKKNLFESFGVSVNNIEKSEYDNIVNFGDKTLNESIIISLVENKEKSEYDLKEVNSIKSELKEAYGNLLALNSITKLNKQIKLVESKAKDLKAEDKTAVDKCIETIKESAKTSCKKAINQLYKLNVMVESILYAKTPSYLKEEDGDDIFVDVPEKKAGGGNKIRLANVGNLKDIVVLNTNSREGVFEFSFKFDIYPTEPFYRDRFEEITILKKTGNNLTRAFNNILYKYFAGHFEFDFASINTASREQLMDKVLEQTGGKSSVKMTYSVEVIDPLLKEEVESDMPKVLEEINSLIERTFPDLLTPDAQIAAKEEVLTTGQTRGKGKALDQRSYDKRSHDILSRKKDQTKAGKDDWIKDMFMSGTIEDDGLDD